MLKKKTFLTGLLLCFATAAQSTHVQETIMQKQTPDGIIEYSINHKALCLVTNDPSDFFSTRFLQVFHTEKASGCPLTYGFFNELAHVHHDAKVYQLTKASSPERADFVAALTQKYDEFKAELSATQRALLQCSLSFLRLRPDIRTAFSLK